MKIAFLDRDGVINRNVGYLHQIKDFAFEVGAVEGMRWLQELGYSIVVITNQSGLARGYFTLEDYERLTQWMLAELKRQGISVLDVLFCPHHPTGAVEELMKDCDCRKPKPGLIEQALARHQGERECCILVGDQLTDIQAGQAAGIPQLFLLGIADDVVDSGAADYRIMDDLRHVAGYLSLQVFSTRMWQN